MSTNGPLNRKLRMGLVGGGQGAFIGRVHATAAVLDNRAALVAGALSSDPAKAKASAADYDIPADRAYGSYQETDRDRNEAAGRRSGSISSPSPRRITRTSRSPRPRVEAGFNVMCDKPLTFDLAQAEELAEASSRRRGVVFAVTHNYTGYPLVRQARADGPGRRAGRDQRHPLASTSKAGCARGWNCENQKQAAWRTDPKAAAPPAASATSARTPTTSAATSPA